MGNFELSSILRVVRKLCGQFSEEPKEVLLQSFSRVSLPISPPPAKNGILLLSKLSVIKLSGMYYKVIH